MIRSLFLRYRKAGFGQPPAKCFRTLSLTFAAETVTGTTESTNQPLTKSLVIQLKTLINWVVFFFVLYCIVLKFLYASLQSLFNDGAEVCSIIALCSFSQPAVEAGV